MKTTILEALRWGAVVLALVLLVSMGAQSKLSTADPEQVTQAVTAQLTMEQMQPGDNQMIKRLYGLQPAEYESCVLYYPTTNMDAEELLIVKLSDLSQQQAVVDAISRRLDTQKTSFDGYGIEQYDLLTNHAVVEVRGNYILFVVSANDTAARQAFVDAL